MISIITTIYKDSNLKTPYSGKKYQVEISDDLKKARVINPYGGVFGMAKYSRFNNLNTYFMAWGGGEDAYAIYSLRVTGKTCFFKLYYLDLNK
jgi:hypothetical protein